MSIDHFPINPSREEKGLLPTYAESSPPDDPERIHYTLPITAPEYDQPHIESAVDADPQTPWYKKKAVRVGGAIGVALAVFGGGGYVTSHQGGEKVAAVEVESGYPDDVVFGTGFSELPLADQVTIRRIHDLTPEQFSALPIESQLQYARHVEDTNRDDVLEYSKLRSGMTGIPALVYNGPPTPSDTAYEVEARRALMLGIASRLVDWSSGQLGQNYNETLKMGPAIFMPGSATSAVFIDSVREAQAQRMTMEDFTPCTVLESQKSGNTVRYTCRMAATEKGGKTHALRTAVWVPFTTYSGKQTGDWVLTQNEGYRSEPHL